MLKDKVIIVTGGTSGIGKACVGHFAEIGAKVIAASNQSEEGRKLQEQWKSKGLDVDFVYTDVSDEGSVRDLVRKAEELHGRIDGIHCNAAVWKKGLATDFDDATWEAVMGVNVKGVLWTAKYGIPAMEKSGQGVLLITTSVAAFVGFPAHVVYCASKAALEAVIRCLATDHAGRVRVVGICPGTIDTPMLAASCEGWDRSVAEIYAEVEQKIPVRRLGQPIDIARAAAFLLSDDASYINATSLTMDGGTMALPPW